jgi:hypothetical protein
MVATLQSLTASHSDYSANCEYWRTLHAISSGGHCVTPAIKKKLLVNVDGTDCDRTKMAPFDSRIGSILVKLTSQLMNTAITPTGSEDSYWQEFFKSCAMLPEHETMQPFRSLLATAALQSLTQGCAIAQIDTAPYMGGTMPDQKSRGGQSPYVILRNRWDLVDWGSSGNGFSYTKLHTYSESRESWNSELTKIHEYTIYQAIGGVVRASTYVVKVRPDAPNLPIEQLEDNHVERSIKRTVDGQALEDVEIFHTTGGVYRFPVVALSFPRQLWLADQLFDLMKSYFNQNTALEWSLAQTNYAMLVFTGIESPHEGENPASRQRYGDGRYLELGDGEDVKFLEKSGNGNALTMQYLDDIRGRMTEVIHTIANNIAMTHEQRAQSGESKKEDRRNLDILLTWYGDQIRKFGESILDVASIARNEVVDWTIDGFDEYHGSDLAEYLADYTGLMRDGGLESKTLRQELQKGLLSKASQSFELDPNSMAKIESELAEDPYNLDDSQRETLVRLASAGLMHPEQLYEILKRSGDLPSDFDVKQAVEMIGQ